MSRARRARADDRTALAILPPRAGGDLSDGILMLSCCHILVHEVASNTTLDRRIHAIPMHRGFIHGKKEKMIRLESEP